MNENQKNRLERLGFEAHHAEGKSVFYRSSHPELKDLAFSDMTGPHTSQLRGRGQIRIIEPDLVVRTLMHGGLLRHVNEKKFLGPERSIREIEISEYLLANAVRTPRILGMIIRESGPLAEISVISALVPGSLDLLTWLETPHPECPDVLMQAGRLMRQIHDLGVYHADLHVKNMLLDSETLLWILDLDKAHQFLSLPRFMKQMNLRRFIRSCRKWQKGGRIHLPENWQHHILDGYTWV